jgi:hypothetical protein
MRILLQDNRSGHYFQGPDKWTPNPARGVDFRFIDRALNYIETWGLKDVRLAFAFDDPPSVTAVPLEKTALQFSAV